MSSPIAINISNLTKHYLKEQNVALNNLNLEIVRGEVFGLLGPNGAGKTTLFSILCGLVKMNSGKVEIEGNDIITQMERIKKIIGIVPQDIALYPTLSAVENLQYFCRMHGIRKSEITSLIKWNLSLFGLLGVGKKPIEKYSGGMKRSINLIAGLLHDPGILLLDEPTVGLDVQNKRKIMSHLKDLNKKKQTTILYTSHDLEQAEIFCDRVGILNEGQLLIVGRPAELRNHFQAGSLEEVFVKVTQDQCR